jgi:GNAT superfamily N-acetyltransferase
MGEFPEPDLSSTEDRRLVEIAEQTIWLGCAAYGADSDVVVGERWFQTGFPYVGLNGVLVAAEPIDVSSILDRFRVRRLPMLWHLGPSSQAGLEAELTAAGCRFEEEEPIMVSDLKAPRALLQPPPGLQILQVEDSSGLAEFVRIWMGTDEQDTVAQLIRLRSATGYGPKASFEHLLGVLDGVPVACAAAFHGPEASEVQHVVTTWSARRRGIGAAMTSAVIARLRVRGARTAVLTASPDGAGIYGELGFRPVGTVRRYAWMPT